MTMTQLAKATGISPSTVSREIGRLETSGVVVVESIGKAKLVQPNWSSPLAQPLRMMLTQTCGPLCELASLYLVLGVVDVQIFGSWAERYQGTPGPYPNDVDVAVIGHAIDFLEIQRACSRAARNLQAVTGGPTLDINPVVFDSFDWNNAEPESFPARVRQGALVAVPQPIQHPMTAPVAVQALGELVSATR